MANNLNATQAYMKAYGATEEAARRSGSRLLTNVDVKAEIDKRLKKITDKAGVTAEMVLKDLVEFKDKCLGRKPITVSHYNDKGKLVDIEKTIFDANGAKTSLELLGKHLKMWTDKQEIEANVGVQIVDDIK
jgi:phage terminase small subunit